MIEQVLESIWMFFYGVIVVVCGIFALGFAAWVITFFVMRAKYRADQLAKRDKTNE